MGKVIINEHDAAQTASKNSSSKSSHRQANQQNRPQISRFGNSADSVGAKMSSKSKGTSSQKIAVHDDKPEKASAPAASAKAKAKPVARINGKDVFGLPAGDGTATKTNNKKIITQARIVETTQVKVAGKPQPKAGANGALDPELALLANRTSAAEQPRIDISKSGKSMSGMIGGPVRRPAHADISPSHQQANPAAAPQQKEESPRFTKFKSILIGVGVAVVVAVIGFACIGIFSGGKNMCTVLFESNGGTKVAGTEIVCGRTVKQPDDPTKEGFTFEGWMYEGSLFDFSNTSLYKNATLVAQWKADDDTEIVTVTFDTNGGSAMSEIELAKGKTLSLDSLSTPKRAGYVFEEWYLGDTPYDFDQPVEENITLRAEWTKQQTSEASSSDNSTPSPTKVASMTASESTLLVENGKSSAVSVSIVPSAATYSLSVAVSSENIASCSINKTTVTCTGKSAGSTSVRVRDANSGVSTTFTVTVPANDVPPVNDDPEITKPEESNPGSTTETPATPSEDEGGNNNDDGDGEEDDNNGGGTTEPPSDQNTTNNE